MPSTTAVGRSLTLTATATDDVGVTALSLRLNNTPQPLDAAGRVTLTPPLVGTCTAVATATDGTGNVGMAQATFEALDAAQDATLVRSPRGGTASAPSPPAPHRHRRRTRDVRSHVAPQ